MSLLPWNHRRPVAHRNDPFGALQDMNDLLNDFFGPSLTMRNDVKQALSPAMDIIETQKGFDLSAEMPGMHTSDIDISVDGHQLTIHAEKKQHEEKRNEDDIVVRSERFYGSYQRTVALPKSANLSDIEACFKKGVLHIHVPKAHIETEPKKIAIKDME